MPFYYPRMLARLTVPEAGTTSERRAQAANQRAISFDLLCQSATLTRNDHNHADELSITCAFRDVGVDPRILRAASVEFWMGDAGDLLPWDPTRKDLRFVGVMKRPKRSGSEGTGLSVSLDFLDYTTLFLEAKNFPKEGIPKMSCRLDEAWRQICDWTGPRLEGTDGVFSVVGALRDRLVLEGGLTEFPVIGTSVSKRFERMACVQKPGEQASAWDVWQSAVGCLGLISYIRLDQCIVTTALDFYSEQKQPRLIWGENLSEISEERDVKFSGLGIGITSFDPLTNTVLEALYPPVGSNLIKRKHLGAGKVDYGNRPDPTAVAAAKVKRDPHAPKRTKPAPTQDQIRQSEEREYFTYYGVTDQKRLDEIARRAWEERSRQELEGTLKTSDMVTTTMETDGAPFDLLDLWCGDTIRVEMAEEDRLSLMQLKSESARVNHLVARGYSEDAAILLARNVQALAAYPPLMHVKTLTVTMALQDKEGTFEISINYHNRIFIDGGEPEQPT